MEPDGSERYTHRCGHQTAVYCGERFHHQMLGHQPLEVAETMCKCVGNLVCTVLLVNQGVGWGGGGGGGGGRARSQAISSRNWGKRELCNISEKSYR